MSKAQSKRQEDAPTFRKLKAGQKLPREWGHHLNDGEYRLVSILLDLTEAGFGRPYVTVTYKQLREGARTAQGIPASVRTIRRRMDRLRRKGVVSTTRGNGRCMGVTVHLDWKPSAALTQSGHGCPIRVDTGVPPMTYRDGPIESIPTGFAGQNNRVEDFPQEGAGVEEPRDRAQHPQIETASDEL